MENFTYTTFELTIVSGQPITASFVRANEEEAESAHYAKMASASADLNCSEALSMVIRSDGIIMKTDHWLRKNASNIPD